MTNIWRIYALVNHGIISYGKNLSLPKCKYLHREDDYKRVLMSYWYTLHQEDDTHCLYFPVYFSDSLTHWGLDKMAAIFKTTFSNAFSGMKICEFWIKLSLKIVPWSPINNNIALVRIMAWRRPGDKPSFDPVLVELLTQLMSIIPNYNYNRMSNYISGSLY